MKLKFFPRTILDTIEQALDQEKNSGQKIYAAFDADGTLWSNDLGENYFKYQIREKLLPNLPASPWEYYRKWKSSGDPRPAYLWLAQIHEGQSLATVQGWAEAALLDAGFDYFFDEQRHLIEYLQSRDVAVYIVTASVKWAVEPAALRLGLSRDNVIGVSTQVKNGVISNQQDGFITYRQGKADALLAKTNGVKPFLGSGNSPGDIELLKTATRVRLAIQSAPHGHELYASESELAQIASSENWLRFSYLK